MRLHAVDDAENQQDGSLIRFVLPHLDQPFEKCSSSKYCLNKDSENHFVCEALFSLGSWIELSEVLACFILFF